MCNAWNHPPGCTCGWGGDGHAGKSPGGFGRVYGDIVGNTDGYSAKPSRWYRPPSTRTSYCVPNAHCPVCGATVFFYQSPYGGRVFFDELGPPWPKHSCTNNSLARYYEQDVRPYRTFDEQPRQFEWQAEWEPLLKVSLTRRSQNGVTQVSGVLGGKPFRCFVSHDHLDSEAPWLVRTAAGGNAELSTIVAIRYAERVRARKSTANAITPISLIAYQTVAEAELYARKHRLGTGAFHGATAPSPRIATSERVAEADAARLAQWRKAHPGLRLNRPLWDNILSELFSAYPKLTWSVLERTLSLHTRTKAYKDAMASNQQRYKLNGEQAGKKRKTKKDKPISRLDLIAQINDRLRKLGE